MPEELKNIQVNSVGVILGPPEITRRFEIDRKNFFQIDFKKAPDDQWSYSYDYSCDKKYGLEGGGAAASINRTFQDYESANEDAIRRIERFISKDESEKAAELWALVKRETSQMSFFSTELGSDW